MRLPTGCRECIFFKKKVWAGKSWWLKMTSAIGHCMDSCNPSFNIWARKYGRGIKRSGLYITPKWCGKRRG